MDDRVLQEVMNDVLLTKGRYPENFMLISQLEVCQEGGVNKGGTWRTGKIDERVIPDVINDVLLP